MEAGDDPYDPDLTVAEALRLRKVVVWGRRTRPGASGLDRCTARRSITVGPITTSPDRCEREEGHSGDHGHVVRWENITEAQVQQATQQLAQFGAAAEAQQAEYERLKKAVTAAGQQVTALLKDEYAKIAQMPIAIQQDLMKAEERRLDRIDSMVYGIGTGKRRDQQYRDKTTAKGRNR